MNNPEQGLGSYHLITEGQGRYSSKPAAALGRTERPTVLNLQNFLPAFGLPRPGVEFALYWVSDEDAEAEYPVLCGSESMMMKYADYRMTKFAKETFVHYLNRVSSVLATVESEEAVTVDALVYSLNQADQSPEQTRKLAVMPRSDNPVEYEQLVTRPGEVFMLLLYVEKHLSYYFVSRHPDVMQMLDELSDARSEGRFSDEWFDDWWTRADTIQMKLVAQNSDKGFSSLVKELAAEPLGKLPDDFRDTGISNLEELVEIRNTIGHSTIYNSIIVDGNPLVLPHITKHTNRPKPSDPSHPF